TGRADKGMPQFNLSDTDLAAIVAFIHDEKECNNGRQEARGRRLRSLCLRSLVLPTGFLATELCCASFQWPGSPWAGPSFADTGSAVFSLPTGASRSDPFCRPVCLLSWTR